MAVPAPVAALLHLFLLLLLLQPNAAAKLDAGATAAPPLDTELEFEAGSSWEAVGYPGLCTGAAGPGETVGADSMPIAWHSRRTNTTFFMSADHRRMFAGTGPTLDNLTGCSARRVLTSFNASTPQSYANFQWLQSVRVFANNTAAGLVHNEFKGEVSLKLFTRRLLSSGCAPHRPLHHALLASGAPAARPHQLVLTRAGGWGCGRTVPGGHRPAVLLAALRRQQQLELARLPRPNV
eukprot:SAG22_NODE_4789_length_1163_cov_1.741541_1_plen_237_part_00